MKKDEAVKQYEKMEKGKAVPMDEFNAMSRPAQIRALCAYHDCPSKRYVVHHKQYVHERWNPHPPAQFIRWWPHYGVLQTEAATRRGWNGVKPVIAFNCEAVREVYREAKANGTLWDTPKSAGPPLLPAVEIVEPNPLDSETDGFPADEIDF